MRDVAEIAPADRKALLAASECKGGLWWTPYHVTDSALAQSGTLTPRGLAVRAHLLSTPADQVRG